MISLVTSFKKFKGVYDNIQRSAIYSWRTLPIYAPASEVDTVKSCSEYRNIKIVPNVRRAIDFGYNLSVPVFKDLMSGALAMSTSTMIGVVSSDIILPDNFLSKCIESFDRYGFDIVIAGTRNNIKLSYLVDSPESLVEAFTEKRYLHDPNYSDIFITSKFIWRKILRDMPDFFFGRPFLNNYLYHSSECQEKRYNCTNSIVTLHPIHSPDYVQRLEKISKETTAQHNQKLIEKQYSIKNWTPL